VRGKVALVTGGSRGIGEMIARAYVENGVKVYITARKAEACDALADELSKSGECISIPGDISRMDEIDRLGAEIEKRENKLDILVNNAGASWGADFSTFPESGWDKVMDLNVKSAFFMTQRVFKLLQAAGSNEDYARVIDIGSIKGMRTSHLEAYSYAASKAAILHVTRMMAKYLAKSNIAVNAIARLFSVEDDGRHPGGGKRSDRSDYTDAALGPPGRHGGRSAVSGFARQRFRARIDCGSRWRSGYDRMS
jgi:NAD(P)-dependent dehydrogenase (short-subunit alcohol dehydrogenase family)